MLLKFFGMKRVPNFLKKELPAMVQLQESINRVCNHEISQRWIEKINSLMPNRWKAVIKARRCPVKYWNFFFACNKNTRYILPLYLRKIYFKYWVFRIHDFLRVNEHLLKHFLCMNGGILIFNLHIFKKKKKTVNYDHPK